ncbi:hypothetical protein HPP92_007603 [Vanilla planifolia]|uniref:Uncharacterized protein n=1 Tax=Vanilla planifolia TaxID=51239 RepID=A0A835RM44_VANPL|nr:hypothetical protein HPP92_007603 [Vanilla planifolia]
MAAENHPKDGGGSSKAKSSTHGANVVKLSLKSLKRTFSKGKADSTDLNTSFPALLYLKEKIGDKKMIVWWTDNTSQSSIISLGDLVNHVMRWLDLMGQFSAWAIVIIS